ncbi:hypothetical protein N9M11_01335 [Flavobacteriaceae bacterium]|uniref:hypothetical protein n=1 Tax=Candidatus Arcticimaribacter forsetii TaxID=2820661 RepID=UPI002076FEF8|nr:hypothetical protein [Candidatus Arcticimaribacter forsetii]MDA8698753.1 hypothetical protein [Flavobacteriaceae bacterium]MDB2325720.1 hypothetical protein [Flavobacteriaceae bacterium]MDB4674690.1 hypothetical protein [Flavobacteriaceae bacterium]
MTSIFLNMQTVEENYKWAETNYGILIQFKGCVSYNYKIDYELFNKLARGYSNFFEIVPDLLVNINNIESVVLDQKDEEYICNLVG